MEHTCAGMHDLSCEACWEEKCRRDGYADELPVGENRYNTFYDEPCEWDVVGGL